MSSGYSSNTFVRPQSQQTANTSIDAPLSKKSGKFGHERNFSDSTADEREFNQSTYFTAAEDESTNTLGNLSHSFSGFSQSSRGTASGSRRGTSIKEVPLPAPLEVDYSSEDSFAAKRIGGEERLLFDDFISSDGGKGLPGLFDALSGPSSPVAPNTPQSANAKQSMRSLKSTPKKSKKRHNLRHSHSTPFAYPQRNAGYGFSSDEEDSDSFFDPEFDYLRDQAFVVPDIRIHASSPGRMSMYGVAEAEEEDKIDTSTAARLRKELNRQKRRTVGHLPHAAPGKGKVRRRHDDDSDGADTEDWGPYR